MSTTAQNSCCDQTHATGKSVDIDATGICTLHSPYVFVPILGGALDLTSYRVNGNETPIGTGLPMGPGNSGGTSLGFYRSLASFSSGSNVVVTNGKGGQSVYHRSSTIPNAILYDPPVFQSSSLKAVTDSLGTILYWVEIDGSSTAFYYNASGQLISQQYLNGSQAYFAYDSSHRVTGITGDVPGQIYFEYGSSGLSMMVQRDLAGADYRGWTYDYDPTSGNLSEVAGPEGCTFLYEYDTLGNVTKETDAENYAEVYQYQDFGTPGVQISRISYPVPNAAVYFSFYENTTGDPASDLGRTFKKAILEPQVSIYYTYDTDMPALQRSMGVPGDSPADPCSPDFKQYQSPDIAPGLYPINLPPGVMQVGDGGTPILGNNGSNSLRTIPDCGTTCIGPVRSYNAGNLVNTTDAINRSSYYRYDSNHNPTAIFDIFGNCAYFTYDSAHRILTQVSKRWPESSPANFTSVYTYDTTGNMLSFANALGQTSYAQFQRGGSAIVRQDQRGYSDIFYTMPTVDEFAVSRRTAARRTLPTIYSRTNYRMCKPAGWKATWQHSLLILPTIRTIVLHVFPLPKAL